MSKKEERRYTSARERAEKHDSVFGSNHLKLPKGASMLKVKEGTMLLDIMPYEVGEGNPFAEEGNLHYERTYFVHRGIGANAETVICPKKTLKQPCPICEHRARLMKSGDEDDEQLVKDLAPKERQLFNVINRKEQDKGVQILDMSNFLFGKVLDTRIRNSDDDDGYDKFFFLEGGLIVKATFAEDSFGGVSFNKCETIDFKPRSEDYDDDILDEVFNLDEMFEVMEYDKLKKLFLEAREEKDDDSDDDDEPKKKRREVEDDDSDSDDDDEKPKKGKSRKEEDSDDDDSDSDEDSDADSDDDEPKSKKKKEPKEDDDDWGDFDEDDSDEEKSKGKKSKKSDDDDSDDEDEKPKHKSKSDDDDSDDDSDSDDDDEPPKKKNRFARQEGDKGWDDDDDSDEDEKPKRKKK